MRPLLLIVLALTLAIAAKPVHGQAEELLYDPRGITEGLMVGLRATFVPGVTVTGERQFEGIDVATTWGTGAGIIVGYGVSPRLLLFGSVDHSAHDSDNARVAGDITLYHFDFGVRFHLHLRDVRYVPYATLAAGGKQLYTRTFIDTLGVVHRATINARAIVPGAGFQFFFRENFAFDGNVSLSIGSFRRIDVEGSGRQKFHSSGGTTARISAGVNWYPAR
jgi:hypothetical protein